MKSPSIVIVGSWNPAILQPEWLAHEIFSYPDQERVPVQMELSPRPGLPPRFTIENLTFVPDYERLTITPVTGEGIEIDDTTLNLMEEKALLVLDQLPHTPISAFGQNFEFTEEHPGDALLSVFELNDDFANHAQFTYTSASITVSTALQLDNRVLNFTRIFKDGRVTVKFNFHYKAATTREARDRLSNSIIDNYRIVTQLLESFGVSLEDDREVSNG